MSARRGRRDELRILLLQIREQPRVRVEEHASFARYAGLDLEQIDILNVFDRPVFPADVSRGYDALFIGGASEASVLEPERYAFLESSCALIREVVATGQPCFASCFGHQLAVIALGGEVVRDEATFEMGTLPISLTEEGRADVLFRDTPDGFLAVSVHRERATGLPKGCVELARTDACLHSFRVQGKPFWTFQFHPEVDRATLVERLTVFKDKYTKGDDELAAVLSSARETPESNVLMRKFVDRVLLDVPQTPS